MNQNLTFVSWMMNQKLSFLGRALGWRALPESLVESRLAADQSQSQTITQFHPKLSTPQSRHCWPGFHGCYCGTLRQKAGWSLMRIGVKSWIKTHFSICSHSSFKDKWQISQNLLEIWLQIKANLEILIIDALRHVRSSCVEKQHQQILLCYYSP